MGKKSGPSQPPPPDPRVVSQAQSESNIATAREQQRLNMINTAGPQGSVNYAADPNAPGGYSQTTTLSPAEQALYDSQKRTELGAVNIAGEQLGRVQTALQTPLNTAGLPALQGGVQRGQLATGFNPGQDVRGGFDPGGQVQTQMGRAGQIQADFDPGGQQATSFDTGGPVQSGFGMGQQLQYGFNPGQQVQGQVGGDLDAARYQNMAGVYGQAASRLDPRFDREQQSLETRLANQGLSVNSEAYRNAVDQFSMGKNDAYNQAMFSSIGAGENAAQAMFGRQMGQGQFANQAAAQMYGQNMGQADFQNRTAGQDYSQNLGAAQFANTAQGQRFGQNQTLAQFGNQAQQTQFGQNQTRAQFGNEAQQQGYGQELARFQAENAAQGQQYGQNQGQATFGNQAAAQQYGQSMGQAQFGNQAQNQDFTQGVANAQLSNTARQQGLNEQAYLQNQPINQLTGLLSLGQVGMPQGVQYSPTQVAGTDVLGAHALQASTAQAQANMRMQQQQGVMNGLFSLGGAAIKAGASDRRIKRNITTLRHDAKGRRWVAFNYVWDEDDAPLREGVIAQEVRETDPDAVSTHPMGFLVVDYAKLEAA